MTFPNRCLLKEKENCEMTQGNISPWSDFLTNDQSICQGVV